MGRLAGFGLVCIMLFGCGDDDGGGGADASAPIDVAQADVDESPPDAQLDAPPPDASLCGNGTMDPGEVCDDGDNEGGDGCRADCLGIEVCNDGFVDVGEYCIPDVATGVSPSFPLNQGQALADIDGDGDIDLALYFFDQMTMTGELNFSLNDGSGGFGALMPTGTNVFVGDFVDVNGDGKPDHLTTISGQPELQVLLGDGLLGFTLASEIASLGPHAFGDLDGDGDLDVVFVDFATDTGRVFLNDGTGVFTAGDTFPAGDEPDGIALGFFDDDVFPDVVVACDTGMANPGGNVNVLFNAGDGTFGTPVEMEAAFPNRPVTADLDADGDDDIVTGNENLFVAGNLFFNNGDGTFTLVTLPLINGNQLAAGITAADLDFDGAAELTGRGHTGTLFLKRNDGAGLFTDFKAYTGTPMDLNRDGAVDLVGTGFDMATMEFFIEARLATP